MYISKRLVQLAIAVIFIALLVFFQNLGVPEQKLIHFSPVGPRKGKSLTDQQAGSQGIYRTASSHFHAGFPKAHELNHSRTLVIPCVTQDEVAWIKEELPNVNAAVYVVNDPAASLHPPKNKGHEVMVYLTYIIEHYTILPDVIVFMHAHRWTSHNNELLEYDGVQMFERLSDSHVTREGYVNMRCSWSPGCPEWLHPASKEDVLAKQEQSVVAKVWAELFPLNPLPPFLAQACCAQFALSRERILMIPLSRFVFYRDWILTTPLTDYISGRIWEYAWQFIFTGQHSYCPAEHRCYCDTFGICFGGEGPYHDFQNLRQERQNLESELERLKARLENAQGIGQTGSISRSAMPKINDGTMHSSDLERRIQALDAELKRYTTEALKRGEDPKKRAEECGRSWVEGDGF